MGSNRKILKVSFDDEKSLIEKISYKLIRDGFNSENTVVITVSTDYSSVIGQALRHLLSINGEICDGFGIDVPYPDQTFNGRFIQELCEMFRIHLDSIAEKNILLVEALLYLIFILLYGIFVYWPLILKSSEGLVQATQILLVLTIFVELFLIKDLLSARLQKFC